MWLLSVWNEYGKSISLFIMIDFKIIMIHIFYDWYELSYGKFEILTNFSTKISLTKYWTDLYDLELQLSDYNVWIYTKRVETWHLCGLGDIEYIYNFAVWTDRR